jgi:hypothetical protein
VELDSTGVLFRLPGRLLADIVNVRADRLMAAEDSSLLRIEYRMAKGDYAGAVCMLGAEKLETSTLWSALRTEVRTMPLAWNLMLVLGRMGRHFSRLTLGVVDCGCMLDSCSTG